MKSAVDYLEAPVYYLTYPTGEEAAALPVVSYNDALRAVEMALADAEEYKYLLVRALRQVTSTADTPVRTLYPENESRPQAA